ncbi:MAG: pilin, partial [Pseudomonadota bacterium]
LTGDYPWLSKRLATALAFKRGDEVEHPSRHKFAWFLSAFVPRFGSGGSASLLITVALIGILAAVAIPAYQDYSIRAQYAVAISEASGLKLEVASYAVANQAWPETLTAMGYESDALTVNIGQAEISLYENGVIGVLVGTNEAGDEAYIVLEPTYDDGAVSWSCYGENVANKYLPASCRD